MPQIVEMSTFASEPLSVLNRFWGIHHRIPALQASSTLLRTVLNGSYCTDCRAKRVDISQPGWVRKQTAVDNQSTLGTALTNPSRRESSPTKVNGTWYHSIQAPRH